MRLIRFNLSFLMCSCCVVPLCKSGYLSQKRKTKEKISLFGVPKDPELRRRWEFIIRRERPLTHKDRVCALHFTPEDLIKYFVTKMPDGSEFKLERVRPVLKPGAVPSIFPGFEKYLNVFKPKISSPKERSNSSDSDECSSTSKFLGFDEDESALQVSSNEQLAATRSPIVELSNSEPSSSESWGFKNILPCLNTNKVNQNWLSGKTKKNIIFSFLLPEDEHQSPVKRVVFYENLSFKVFVNNMNIAMEQELNKESDLYDILSSVYKMKLCNSVIKKNQESLMNKCTGVTCSIRSSLCLSCRDNGRGKKENSNSKRLSVKNKSISGSKKLKKIKGHKK